MAQSAEESHKRVCSTTPLIHGHPNMTDQSPCADNTTPRIKRPRLLSTSSSQKCSSEELPTHTISNLQSSSHSPPAESSTFHPRTRSLGPVSIRSRLAQLHPDLDHRSSHTSGQVPEDGENKDRRDSHQIPASSPSTDQMSAQPTDSLSKGNEQNTKSSSRSPTIEAILSDSDENVAVTEGDAIYIVSDSDDASDAASSTTDAYSRICQAFPRDDHNEADAIASASAMGQIVKNYQPLESALLVNLYNWYSQQEAIMRTSSCQLHAIFLHENAALLSAISDIFAHLSDRRSRIVDSRNVDATLEHIIVSLLRAFASLLAQLLVSISQLAIAELTEAYTLLCEKSVGLMLRLGSMEDDSFLGYLHRTTDVNGNVVASRTLECVATKSCIIAMARILTVKAKSEKLELLSMDNLGQLLWLSLNRSQPRGSSSRASSDQTCKSLEDLLDQLQVILPIDIGKETAASPVFSRGRLTMVATGIMQYTLNPPAQDLMQMDGVQLDGADPELLAQCRVIAWISRICTEYMRKGCMKLRTWAVEQLRWELLQAHHRANQLSAPQRSNLLTWTTRVLDREQVLNVIFGVESRAEIIDRARNIVAFYAEADQLTPGVMGICWHAVTRSQDHWASKAAANLCQYLVGTYCANIVKMQSILEAIAAHPIHTATPMVRSVIQGIINEIVRHQPGIFEERIGELALRLQLELLNSALCRDEQTADNVLQLQASITALRAFAKDDAIPDSLLQQTIRLAVTAIGESACKSDASILAILALCSSPNQKPLDLEAEFALSSKLKDDFCIFTNSRKEEAAKAGSSLISRVDLLLLVLSRQADQSNASTLLMDLLDSLVGEKAASVPACDVVWTRMSNMLAQNDNQDAASIPSPSTMTFTMSDSFSSHRTICDGYLAVMPGFIQPRKATGSLLGFVKCLIHYQLAERQDTAGATPIDLLTLPTVSLLWQIMICSDYRDVAEEAARFTAGLYLNRHVFAREADTQEEVTSMMRDAHKSLVAHCVDRLVAAFDAVKQSRSSCDIRDDAEVSTAKRTFSRVLGFATAFIDSVATAYPPIVHLEEVDEILSRLNLTNDPGKPIVIPLSLKVSGVSVGDFSLRIGDLSTQAELQSRLSQIVGYRDMNLFWSGARVSLMDRPMQTLRESGAPNKNRLLITASTSANPIRRTAQTELQNHHTLQGVFQHEFTEHRTTLFSFLEFGDDLAEQSLKFLGRFPPVTKLVTLTDQIRSLDTATPFSQSPFMILHVLEELERSLDDVILPSSDDAIAECEPVLQNIILNISAAHTQVELRAASCLLSILRHVNTSRPCNQQIIAKLLSRLITRSLALAEEGNPAVVVFYSLILEYALCTPEACRALISNTDTSALQFKVLITNPSFGAKQNISDIIATLLVKLRAHGSPPDWTEEFRFSLWSSLASNVVSALSEGSSTSVFFKITTFVTNELLRNDLDLNDVPPELDQHCRQWTSALVSDVQIHQGRDLIARNDRLVYLAKLVTRCYDSLPEDTDDTNRMDIIGALCQQYLFSRTDTDTMTEPSLLCSSQDRSAIYDLLQTYVYGNPVEIARLVRHNNEALAKMRIDGSSNNSVMVDSILRSSTGCVGFHNLGATCFMNALLIQLYTNVDLRNFMLTLELPEGDQSEQTNLLRQTQRIFAWLSQSKGRALDASQLAASIRDIEGLVMSTTRQMDVEEFFNLLFGQWEAQLPSPDARLQFKSIYGGKQISRVTSKECHHVSDREESFTNIQCSLDGAASLEESLARLVQGEEMEGDNKYKCESCSPTKFVNAARRTCFQQLPDNLVFHLLRFTYDIYTQDRAKNNSYFEFQGRINMTPYTFAHLSAPEDPCEPDWFELVGVLLHSGQAENGHYISYARVQSQTSTESARWAKFDDDVVTEFNPANIPYECFGGPVELKSGALPTRSMKVYSAYMLFYERASKDSVMHDRQAELYQIPSTLLQEIQKENSKLLRDYCLMSQPHVRHVDEILHMVSRVTKEHASPELQTETTQWFCRYISRLLCRKHIAYADKDRAVALEVVIQRFNQLLGVDASVYEVVLQYFAEDPIALADVLVRVQSKVQVIFRKFLMHCIGTLWHATRDTDGPDTLHADFADPETTRENVFYKFIAGIKRVIDAVDFYDHDMNHWHNFFTLIHNIACIDAYFAKVMIEQGFLQMYLSILCSVDGYIPFARDMGHLCDWRLAEAVSKGSTRSFRRVCIGLAALISQVSQEPHVPPSEFDRLTCVGPQHRIPLNDSEVYLLQLSFEGKLVWLDRCLLSTQLPANNLIEEEWVEIATMIKALCKIPCQRDAPIHQTLMNGICDGLAGHIRAVVPYVITSDYEEPATAGHMASLVADRTRFFTDRIGNAVLLFWRDLWVDGDENTEPLCYSFVHRWAMPMLRWISADDLLLGVFDLLKEMLGIPWDFIQDDAAIAMHLISVRDKLQAIRELYIACEREINSVSRTRDYTQTDMRELIQAMQLCQGQLKILARRDAGTVPAEWTDERDAGLLAEWPTMLALYRNLPEVCESEYASDDSDDNMSYESTIL